MLSEKAWKKLTGRVWWQKMKQKLTPWREKSPTFFQFPSSFQNFFKKEEQEDECWAWTAAAVSGARGAGILGTRSPKGTASVKKPIQCTCTRCRLRCISSSASPPRPCASWTRGLNHPDIREVQTAVRLWLPREVATHTVSKGTKSMTKYSSSEWPWTWP